MATASATFRTGWGSKGWSGTSAGEMISAPEPLVRSAASKQVVEALGVGVAAGG